MTKTGQIASLHVHPDRGGESMVAVESMELVAQKGIVQDTRYFGKARRQVSLIGREQLTEHSAALKIDGIAPGQARANIETAGIDLNALVGRNVQLGEAVLFFYEDRIPCHKMDAVCQGLRTLMEHGKQGVLATVVKSGTIRAGDVIQPIVQS